MQAERKELQGNALAQQLKGAYDGIKQGPSRPTIILLALVITGVLLFVLFRYFWVSSAAADSHRWLMVDQATFPEELNTLLEDKEIKDTPQYRILRFKEARMKMEQGIRDLGHLNPNLRKDARKNIEEAVEVYDKLAKESTRSPQLHQEALWASAKGYETLGGSDNLERAIERYETLKKEYEKSALGKDARKQLERLSNPSTRQTLSDLNRAFEGE
jgi:hypothetical protein